MKTKTLLFSILMLVLSTTSFSQFSRQQAIDLVINTILVSETGSINVYCTFNSKTGQQTILLDNGDSVGCTYTDNWVFFIDDDPTAFWAHQARFIFVNTQNGDYTILNHYMLPFKLYTDFELISHIPYPENNQIPEYAGESLTQAEPNEHLYAVLIGTTQQPTFWYDISMIFNTLIDVYGYTKENIYVHFWDGTSGNYNSNDLDGDDIGDIDYSAFLQRLDTTFRNLTGEWTNDPAIPQLGPADQLYIHFDGHGNSSDTTNKISYLDLYGDDLYDTTFANYLKDIECAQMIITMQNCFSGGFIDDVTDYTTYNVKCENRFIATASDYDEPARVEQHIVGIIPGIPSYIYGEFDFYIFSALRGIYPDIWGPEIEPWNTANCYPVGQFPFDSIPTLINHPSDFIPDFNNDTVIQMNEAFDYMNDFNTWSPYGYFMPYDTNEVDFPQHSNTLPFTQDLLSLKGISGNISTSGSIPGRNYMFGGDLIVNPNTQLTIDGNSNLYFASNTANLNILENGELITGDEVSFYGNSGNNIIIEGGLQLGNSNIFSNLYTDESFGGLHINNYGLQLSICNADLIKSGFNSYCNSLNISNSSFDDCFIIYSHRGNVTISDNTSFNRTWLYLENIEDNNNTVTISACTFTTDIPMPAIDLWNYNQYTISNNTIDGYYNGIQILQSGYGDTKKNMISDNTITNCTQRGILAYGTRGAVYRNHITNNRYGVWFGDHSSLRLYGNSGAISNDQTQEIQDNDLWEVYASKYSFPIYFRYNVIIDDNNGGAPEDPLVYHSGGEMSIHDVRYNCWEEIAGSFVAAEDLYPGGYIWEPEWCPGSGNSITLDPDEDMYEVANNLFDAEDYTGAKSMYEMLIDQYPQSKFAKAAMQELFALEKFVSNDYSDLKQYYANNTDPELTETGDYMVSKCNIKLENWPDAISYYESIILDPETLEDSIFAIVDLGYVYFVMENSGYKSAYTGNLVQYKPESKEQFFDYRNYLLSLIPGDQMSETMKGNIAGLKEGELLQNVPNPFKGSTQIWYKLNAESNVELKVYNYTGQLISTINEGTKTKGTHHIDFNATGLKNGIYFYSISINGQTSDSKKMTVMK